MSSMLWCDRWSTRENLCSHTAKIKQLDISTADQIEVSVMICGTHMYRQMDKPKLIYTTLSMSLSLYYRGNVYENEFQILLNFSHSIKFEMLQWLFTMYNNCRICPLFYTAMNFLILWKHMLKVFKNKLYRKIQY